MDRTTPRIVKEKMVKSLALFKEALDMSIPMLKTNQKNNIIVLWHAFAREIVFYVKYRSRETGINLYRYISAKRIFFK